MRHSLSAVEQMGGKVKKKKKNKLEIKPHILKEGLF